MIKKTSKKRPGLCHNSEESHFTFLALKKTKTKKTCLILFLFNFFSLFLHKQQQLALYLSSMAFYSWWLFLPEYLKCPINSDNAYLNYGQLVKL